MEEKEKKKAPAIDSVIATGPDMIQLPKRGEKEVATDRGRILYRRHHQNLIRT
jgi:hypothetical protein